MEGRCLQSFTDLVTQKINASCSKLSGKFPELYTLAYFLPFSPFRGLTWRFFGKSDHTVLDVGVFRGAVGRLIRLREKDTHFIVGIDMYRPYVDSLKHAKIYDALVLADMRYLPFRDGFFDAVVALEVIEHLPKKDGLSFLLQLERLAERKVIVSTPVGFLEIHNLDSEYQKHLSGWLPSEFRDLGWKIKGTYGIRPFPTTLAYYISYILPLSYCVPSYAYNITCIKKCVR